VGRRLTTAFVRVEGFPKAKRGGVLIVAIFQIPILENARADTGSEKISKKYLMLSNSGAENFHRTRRTQKASPLKPSNKETWLPAKGISCAS
jgi:hypothetical protein